MTNHWIMKLQDSISRFRYQVHVTESDDLGIVGMVPTLLFRMQNPHESPFEQYVDT